MNKTTPDPLADLRDVHLPEAIGWWPPALGWWLLLASVMMVMIALLYFLRWRKTQSKPSIVFSRQDMVQAALLELTVIEQRHAEDDRQAIADISQLLRRCALQLTNSSAVAGLTGEHWLNWLDSRWQRDDFSQGNGRILIDAPYRKSDPDTAVVMVVVKDMCQISRDWLQSL
ncbi:MAG: DUF4381 domain-containing protein [Mariprofundus sp.]|nr:DUF4381 domain-containing protein [Mariprofundus sp.]